MTKPKTIALVSDAWAPQVNGVVRTLSEVCNAWREHGHNVVTLTPDKFRTIPCPTYPEIRLAINAWPKMGHMLEAINADAIHIATEGPLGWAARSYCLKHDIPFTTAFHTKFPEYVNKRTGLPKRWGYALLRKFHAPAAHMMVATPSLARELEAKGFTNCTPWTRGVDTELFHPSKRQPLDYPAPILLYVGRVAVEKNIEAFLSLHTEGTKLIVGDGPARADLEKRYPEAVFLGVKKGEELATLYASADCFVFPSKTDTFGLVMLEAMAAGTPVAAYPVTGPLDVLKDGKAAAMHETLSHAIEKALTLSRDASREYALNFSWQRCADLLSAALQFKSS